MNVKSIKIKHKYCGLLTQREGRERERQRGMGKDREEGERQRGR